MMGMITAQGKISRRSVQVQTMSPSLGIELSASVARQVTSICLSISSIPGALSITTKTSFCKHGKPSPLPEIPLRLFEDGMRLLNLPSPDSYVQQ